MVLSDGAIRRQIAGGRIVVRPIDLEDIQPASIDLRLDRRFLVFSNARQPYIDVRGPLDNLTEEVCIEDDRPFMLHPGEFALGSTVEHIELPDDLVARLEGKSSLGRLGLLIHSTAGYVDPGWKGHLTLELSNVARLPIALYYGMKIGQISFLQLTAPAERLYGSPELGSRYQGQTGPTASRLHQDFTRRARLDVSGGVDPMQRALALARMALGSTSPNPAVGAVVERDGSIVGEGYTLPPGQRHAEIGALQQAGDRAKGATLYSTLEPCCHYGRTPPCTDAIIAAGISRVIYAAEDPNPRVAGRGGAALRAAGLEVEPRPNRAADELYQAFAKHVTSGLPYVVAKFAMSLDGKIATRTGDSQWITGPDARARVQRMRKEVDGIMVGIGTALADDPQLTARDESGEALAVNLQPLRVVVDSKARVPADARVFSQPGRTLVAVSENANASRIAALEDVGATVQVFPGTDGRVNLPALLEYLGAAGVVSLLVEGGGGVLGSLLDARLIDKLHVFLGPALIGGAGARSPIEGEGAALMADAWRLEMTSMESIGEDWLITGYPIRGDG